MTHAPPARVMLLVLDVDGVMTDGSIILNDEGVETKRFHVRDGFGIRLWHEMGLQTAIITGRSGGVVEHRARELRIAHVVQGSRDKAQSLTDLCSRLGITPPEAAFLGDDWPDLPAMRLAGYPMAVADASPEVLRAARFVTALPGGRGAVRQAVEHILEAKGLLDRARAMYDRP